VDRYRDVIRVGDSLGNVMHGFETTVPVTLEMMILQGHAVMRGSQHTLVGSTVVYGAKRWAWPLISALFNWLFRVFGKRALERAAPAIFTARG